jgi:uncharacterized membrane protein YraQ (UPF0718 family)
MILAGLLLTASMMASNAMKLILKSFEGRMVSMIVLSSLIGAITPVCGATVLPLIAGLLMARVPLAPIMAFWLSSPITDPAMLLLTAATLGWPFALAKTLGAVLAGLLGGIITLKLSHSDFISDPMKPTYKRAQGLACSSLNEQPVLACFWQEPARVKQFTSTLISTGKLMLVWLSLAFIAEFYLIQYLPLDWLPQVFGKENFWAIPLAALIGAPIYLDGYAALPLIRSLMDAGMRPDAALTFLIAGGITSAWAAIPVYALVNKKVFLLYLALATSASILAGLTLGNFL